MIGEKLDVQDFVWNFTSDEVVTIKNFLQRLTLLWTPEVEELLQRLSNGFISMSGISAAKGYFTTIKNLELPDEKRGLVYEALKDASVSDLLHELSDYLESQKKEEAVIAETVSGLEPEISQDEWPAQIEAVSYVPRMRESTVQIQTKYYPIDDEEYMVKSKYVHPSPTGVEEGYPPLVKKKKKVPVDY